MASKEVAIKANKAIASVNKHLQNLLDTHDYLSNKYQIGDKIEESLENDVKAIHKGINVLLGVIGGKA
jgi:hypothetical protein